MVEAPSAAASTCYVPAVLLAAAVTAARPLASLTTTDVADSTALEPLAGTVKVTVAPGMGV